MSDQCDQTCTSNCVAVGGGDCMILLIREQRFHGEGILGMRFFIALAKHTSVGVVVLGAGLY
jgi:hypothetical protein